MLAEAGCPDPAGFTALANTPEVKVRLRAQSERAVTLGLFGAPCFVVGSEVFWGADRLEQALAWAVETGAAAA